VHGLKIGKQKDLEEFSDVEEGNKE